MGVVEQVRQFARLPFLVPPRRIMSNKYRDLMTHLRATLIDRTGTLVDPAVPNISVSQNIPSVIVWPGDFAQVCDAAVEELVQRAQKLGRGIVLMYSGGLDSVCVSCALIKAGVKFTALGSVASVEENPEFYKKVLEKNPLVTTVTGNPLLFLADHPDEHVFVTGECGAHIMGTVLGWEASGVVGDSDSGVVSRGGDSSAFSNPEPFFDVEEPLRSTLLSVLDHCPVPIKTNYDAHWWKIFALKWQFVSFRMQLYAGQRSKELFNFFMTDKFQQWALCNDVNVKCPGFDWRNYKMPMRDYIYAVSGDSKAAYETPKRYSLERTYTKMARIGETFILDGAGRDVGFLFDSTRDKVQQRLLIMEGS